MKKPHILLLLIFGLSLSLAAQGPENPMSQQRMRRLAYMSAASHGFQTFSDVNRLEGMPYFFEDWRIGRVKFADEGAPSEEVGIMLDMQDQRLYVKLDDEFIGEFPISKVETVELYDNADTLHFAVYDLGRQYENGPKGFKWYHILHRGNYLVMHQQTKYLRKEEYIENLGMVRRPDKFMSMDAYWLLAGDELFEIRKKQKSLEKTLPHKASLINRLVKKNDLNLKEDADLGLLFALLEQSEQER